MCSHVFLEISIMCKGFCTENTMNVFLSVHIITHDLWKILDRECRDNFFILNVFSSDSLNYYCMWTIFYRKCRDMVFILNVFPFVPLNFHKLSRIFCQVCSVKVLPECNLLCIFKSPSFVKNFEHKLQKCLLSECVLLCSFKYYPSVKNFVQRVQGKGSESNTNWIFTNFSPKSNTKMLNIWNSSYIVT